MRTLEQDAVASDRRALSALLGEPENWRTEHPDDYSELDLYAREEWKLACRIATSKGMAKSELLPRFLLHICEMSLRGRKEEITEQRIGMQIFNRPAGYNPGEDNIVRSYARTLRKRLDDYFVQDGRDEPLRMTIPRGGYVPLFELAQSVNGREDEPVLARTEASSLPSVVPDTATVEAGGAASPRVWFAAAWGMLAGLLLAGAIWAAWAVVHRTAQQSAAHKMWSQLFQTSRQTLIVPADSGLGILENLSRRSVSVEQYANGSYLDDLTTASIDPENFTDIGRQRYTSMVDLNVIARLGRLPEYLPERSSIRFVRAVTAEDIKTSNVILIGSKHTNPWVGLFERGMNFTLTYSPKVDESFLQNRAPAKGEQAVYRNAAAGTSGPTYGVIAYLPSLDGAGHVLIVEGLNMAGTEAAAEALFYSKLIQPALRQATAVDGTLRPFELLVETSSVGATSPEARILAIRVHEN
jgi:hypothetical protein